MADQDPHKSGASAPAINKDAEARRIFLVEEFRLAAIDAARSWDGWRQAMARMQWAEAALAELPV